MQLTWAEPGARSAFVGTDGREYWNVGQAASKPAAYRVQYTIDGGAIHKSNPRSRHGNAVQWGSVALAPSP
eukprot:2039778-Prymnesium_polylepis.1